MTEPDNCKGFLERALEIPISRVKVSKEKSIVYHPEYKGSRLDVYAKDENSTYYNVEMQVMPKPALGKRSRYYQSQIDMELLLSGKDYAELPDTYVIFICDFDPFGQRKYRYTFQTSCKESAETDLRDSQHIMFLSTCGENAGEVPKELVTFLMYVKADLTENEYDFHDKYIEQLQRSVREIKRSRETEERFMIPEELGKVPEEIRKKIVNDTCTENLTRWAKAAVKANTIEEFIMQFKGLLYWWIWGPGACAPLHVTIIKNQI